MQDSIFGKYELSDYALSKIAEVKNKINSSSKNVKLWKSINDEADENSIEPNDISTEIIESHNSSLNSTIIASQFYFSQRMEISSDTSELPANVVTEVETIEKLLRETLEQPNGNIDLNLLKNLSASELTELLETLNQHLSTTGLLNILKAMTDFNAEQKIRYFDVICSKIILGKITELDKPGIGITKSMVQLTNNFPDEMRKMIFIPILNYDLKDYSIVSSIVDIFGAERYNILLMDFTSHANEIKEWHIPLIERLISPPIEKSIKSQLVNMFLDKCAVFKMNRTFGKLMVAFITVGASFSETEVNILNEIADVHKTPLKRAMVNAIKKVATT